MADNLPDVYLRFADAGGKCLIEGECLDEQHPGKDGWIGIEHFNFGFGWGGSEAAQSESSAGSAAHAGSSGTKSTGATPAAKGSSTAGKGGTLTPKEFSFSKAPDLTSNVLLLKCKDSEMIPKVEVVVCRYGGTGTEIKIPFLKLIFETVVLKKCSLSISTDPVPTESIDFKYAKVTMETIWTDNATGNREPGDPLRVWFDFDNQKGTSSWGEDA